MGLRKANQTSFRKGLTPWNKGKKGVMIAWNKGLKGVMPIPWNKDKKGWVSKEQKGAISKANKGRIPQNKGISKYPKQINCIYCGKLFNVPINNAKNRKFCNPLCQSNFMIGKKHSEETNKKIGFRQKDVHEKVSLREKHWNWKGGITPENKKIRNSIEIRLWREAVFARDNWTCQKYGIRGERIIAHHIQNFAQFPELRFAIDNGITLSEKSHKEFHKKYGNKNNTKEQLMEFLTNKRSC